MLQGVDPDCENKDKLDIYARIHIEKTPQAQQKRVAPMLD